jgi:hypothetical protein
MVARTEALAEERGQANDLLLRRQGVTGPIPTGSIDSIRRAVCANRPYSTGCWHDKRSLAGAGRALCWHVERSLVGAS